jgi:glucokinase
MRNAAKKSMGWAMGIDVGGTKVAAGVVRFPNGEVGKLWEIPTRSGRGGEKVLKDVEKLAALVMEEGANAGKFLGVGVGVCELVSGEGELMSANCLNWRSRQVRGALGRFGPVRIEADVRAAARAEAKFGAGKGAHSFLYVTVGTGISSCLVIEGKPFAGARGAAGTMASGPLPDIDGRAMPSLETAASGPGLVATYNVLVGQDGKVDTAQELLRRAEAKEESAVRVVRRGARVLGGTIGWMISVLDPELVVMGGGLGLRRGLYRRLIIESVREHVWWKKHRAVKVVPAKSGAAAGVIGAANLMVEDGKAVSGM